VAPTTLFTIAPAVQGKLLDVLEERTDEQTPGADVRYIGATQRDIAAAVERGQFRRDLYYRLGVISIEMPPLRERGADRLLLARHFTERCAHKLGSPSALRRGVLTFSKIRLAGQRARTRANDRTRSDPRGRRS
jgi:transcriptional regulator with GAF, ATPase, and Fis domain